MKGKTLDNRGMTLIELLVCFTILSALLVVAGQIIHSSTEVYYQAKTNAFGIQASQIIATELRGEIEDALPMQLIDNESGEYIRINNNTCTIEYIDQKGKQVQYSLISSLLKVKSSDAYDSQRFIKINLNTSVNYDEIKTIDSKYIGMGYYVKNIKIQLVSKPTITDQDRLPISDYPVLLMEVTVGNNQYDDYVCKEHIPLYNFYGISDINNKILINN